MNQRLGEHDPGTHSQAGPCDRRLWSCWARDSLMGVLDLYGLGNAPHGRWNGHVNHARHAALERLGSRSRISDVGDHDGCDDGPHCQPSDSAFR